MCYPELSPSEATKEVKKRMKFNASVVFTRHATERMLERNIDDTEVYACLRSGVVKTSPELRSNDYHYRVESNLHGGITVLVVIPSDDPNIILVTVLPRKKKKL